MQYELMCGTTAAELADAVNQRLRDGWCLLGTTWMDVRPDGTREFFQSVVSGTCRWRTNEELAA